ncbi:hypothetical protein AMTRI_Chr07g24950 [Amborella trichopoda]
MEESSSGSRRDAKIEKLASQLSLCDSEDDIEESKDDHFVPGPLLPLKQQLELDKDDESLRRWKEKLLGQVDTNLNGPTEAEVTFLSLGIISDNCPEMNTSLSINENQNNISFVLKEGSRYHLNLIFKVQYNIVSGLTYSNTVWKGGVRVDESKGMLGTFAPQQEPYTHTLDEETTPSGVLARGVYSAKLKFEDDDKRCHLELDYSFEIKKSC